MIKNIKNIFGKSRNCPICNSNKFKFFLKEKIDLNLLNNFSFASRKNPEFLRHQLVKCLKCNLIYTNKPMKQEIINSLYSSADFNSSIYAEQATKAYIYGLRSVISNLNLKSHILDVGCGEGSFLKKISEIGFKNILGIEPSKLAVNYSNPVIKKKIKIGFFSNKIIKNKKFDLITFFMTLEHVPDPLKTVKQFHSSLNNNGVLSIVVHDSGSIINKMLGSKSPIIDIEHLQLFNSSSLKYLFEEVGFKKITIKPLKNFYSIDYLIKLLPIPAIIKNPLINFLIFLRLNKISIPLKLGNIIAVAYK